MNRQIKTLIYIIMAISLVACTFVGVRRIQVETNYKNVEIAMRYSDILRISIEGEVPLEEVLTYFKNQGVTTILAKEMTVVSPTDRDYNTFKGRGLVTLVEGYILKLYHPEVTQIRLDSRYIVTEDAEVAQMIDEAYQAKGIELAQYEADDTYFLEVGAYSSGLTTTGVGFDTENLNLAASLGFSIAPQVKYWDNTTDEVMPEATKYLISEIEALNHVNTIYFADSKVPAVTTGSFPKFLEDYQLGFIEFTSNKQEGFNTLAKKTSDFGFADSKVPAVTTGSFPKFLEDYQLGFIEFTSNKQEGFNTLAKKTSDFGSDYKVVRLHTLEDNKVSTFKVSDLMERYELALKERSIRTFLFKLPQSLELEDDVTYLDEAITTFKTIAEDLMERYELALKERSIRTFLFKLPQSLELEDDVTYLDEAITTFKTIAEKDGYIVTNQVDNYNFPTIPVYVAILVGLASIMVFILLLAEASFIKTGYVLGILGIIGYVGLLKLKPNLASQLMALFGSIMFPTYAVIKGLSERNRDIKGSILALLKICLISFGGVLTIIGCLSRTNFALTLDVFMGVKVAMAAPIMLVLTYLIYDKHGFNYSYYKGILDKKISYGALLDVFMGVKVAMAAPIMLVLTYLIYDKHGFNYSYYKGILDKKISYGALIALGALAIVLYVYVSRTGNTGTATDLERAFRQLLDNILGVRPRTKEFLIAYPVLLTLLYYGYKERYIVAVIIAVIGPVSLVNTYAHIHTPILISLIRSAYGIIFGILLGLVLIGVIKLMSKVIKRCQIQTK